MNHDRARRLLPAYADRQIGPIRRFLLGRHIARCPSCLAELEAMQAMRTALRTNLTVHRAPPALAMRIGSALPREAPPPVRRAAVALRLCRGGDGGRFRRCRADPGGDAADAAARSAGRPMSSPTMCGR